MTNKTNSFFQPSDLEGLPEDQVACLKELIDHYNSALDFKTTITEEKEKILELLAQWKKCLPERESWLIDHPNDHEVVTQVEKCHRAIKNFTERLSEVELMLTQVDKTIRDIEDKFTTRSNKGMGFYSAA